MTFDREAYERTMRAGMQNAAAQPADKNPYTVHGCTEALFEAMHRLINHVDELDKMTMPFRTPAPPPFKRDDDEDKMLSTMSEVAARIDTAVGNINAVADRLQAMADGFK